MAAAMATSCSTLASSVACFSSSKVVGNANAARKPSSVRMVRCQANGNKAEEKEVQRRAVVAGVGVAILSLVASGAANAIPPVPPGQPKPGSKEALKKYANICVSNPTAAICHS